MVQNLHTQHPLSVGIAEFGILGPFDVNKNHEDVGEEHVFLLFDSNLLSKIFSKIAHEALSCIIIILLDAGVVLGADS